MSGRLDYLMQLGMGHVTEFAFEREVLLEALHGLETQLNLTNLMLATLRAKKVYFPLEFLRAIAEKHQQRHFEFQMMLGEMAKTAQEFGQGEVHDGEAAFDDGEALVNFGVVGVHGQGGSCVGGIFEPSTAPLPQGENHET